MCLRAGVCVFYALNLLPKLGMFTVGRSGCFPWRKPAALLWRWAAICSIPNAVELPTDFCLDVFFVFLCQRPPVCRKCLGPEGLWTLSHTLTKRRFRAPVHQTLPRLVTPVNVWVLFISAVLVYGLPDLNITMNYLLVCLFVSSTLWLKLSWCNLSCLLQTRCCLSTSETDSFRRHMV